MRTTALEAWLGNEKKKIKAASRYACPKAIAVIEKLKEALEHYDRQLYYEESEFGRPEYTMEEIENLARPALELDPEKL